MELFDLVLALPIILLGAIVLILSFRKDEIYWKEIPVRGVTKEAKAILEEEKTSLSLATRESNALRSLKESQAYAEALDTPVTSKRRGRPRKLDREPLSVDTYRKLSQLEKIPSELERQTTTGEKSPKGRSKKIKSEVISTNKCQCLGCGAILESKSVHDFQQCDCPLKTFTDGGHDYIRRGGMDLSKIKDLDANN